MIRIELQERIGDGTHNINVLIKPTNNEETPHEFLTWLSYMDVWNYSLHVYTSDDKYELPKEMKPYLYSESFRHFVGKFFKRTSEFEIICY